MTEIAELTRRILSGDRRALARAVTLVESTRDDHRAKATALMEGLRGSGRQALRIGLSGTPGVGKSTFIEAFGMMLTEAGLRVAVLAVDPSSARSGGSILGDKTRMERLSREKGAFIRPSPSSSQLGGVARRTREAVALCEAAGFDVVLIETVGVGQSETMVAEMCDLFVLLLAPAGGDELQGVKRGIMEMADLILINKADGDLKATATRTVSDYSGALRLLRKRPQDPEGFPKALPVSAVEGSGLRPRGKICKPLPRRARQAAGGTGGVPNRRPIGSRKRSAGACCASCTPIPRSARPWPIVRKTWPRGGLRRTLRPGKCLPGCLRPDLAQVFRSALYRLKEIGQGQDTPLHHLLRRRGVGQDHGLRLGRQQGAPNRHLATVPAHHLAPVDRGHHGVKGKDSVVCRRQHGQITWRNRKQLCNRAIAMPHRTMAYGAVLLKQVEPVAGVSGARALGKGGRGTDRQTHRANRKI
ncbi:putative periplasmic protein kinase ArgK [Roseibacterium elongatum DSM 19469]|uniref:Putative periplasmic protein kinase ArgK n=1 Tax=Roseicyclus elongatus DSM 19469 TaxID=1294273 RepID=W8S5N8_9RHOB|nr:putative periplasmic protein kinase ArgK [Roseibacterium elongatum DSM 19469]